MTGPIPPGAGPPGAVPRGAIPDGPGDGSPRPLGVAVIGFGWMGAVHSAAYRRLAQHFPQLLVQPRLVAVCDPEPERAADAVRRFGFAQAHADWAAALADPQVHAVSVTAPNHLHRELGVAVAEAGKHLWIEKPVGLSADDARQVAAAVARAGVCSAVGFNYRHAPAVALARRLIADGSIGTVTNAHIGFSSDYAAHPDGALSWRFRRRLGGSGVLGDLLSHAVDLARHLVGELDALVADTATFIGRRPEPLGVTSHFSTAAGGPSGEVENEDFVSCLVRFSGGARGTLEASRVSVGDQNRYGFRIHGTRGQLAWDFRRMGELQVCAGGDYLDQPTSTVFAGPGHGDYAAFQPGAGMSIGYDDLKVIEAAGFVRAITEGTSGGPTVVDAVRAAEALDAVTESVRTGRWVTLPAPQG